jgi:zinc finger protein DZIP1
MENSLDAEADLGMTTAVLRDQFTAPLQPVVSFPPFKFEPRRVRVDWRLLHGVDTNKVVRF